MTQPNSKFERLLSQRAHTTFRKLCDFNDRRFRLRMSAQLFHIGFAVFATHDSLLLCFLSHSMLLDFVKRPSSTHKHTGKSHSFERRVQTSSINNTDATIAANNRYGFSAKQYCSWARSRATYSCCFATGLSIIRYDRRDQSLFVERQRRLRKLERNWQQCNRL